MFPLFQPLRLNSMWKRKREESVDAVSWMDAEPPNMCTCSSTNKYSQSSTRNILHSLLPETQTSLFGRNSIYSSGQAPRTTHILEFTCRVNELQYILLNILQSLRYTYICKSYFCMRNKLINFASQTGLQHLAIHKGTPKSDNPLVLGTLFPFLNQISKDNVILKALVATEKERENAECLRFLEQMDGGRILANHRVWGRRKRTRRHVVLVEGRKHVKSLGR